MNQSNVVVVSQKRSHALPHCLAGRAPSSLLWEKTSPGISNKWSRPKYLRVSSRDRGLPYLHHTTTRQYSNDNSQPHDAGWAAVCSLCVCGVVRSRSVVWYHFLLYCVWNKAASEERSTTCTGWHSRGASCSISAVCIRYSKGGGLCGFTRSNQESTDRPACTHRQRGQQKYRSGE